MIKKKKNVENVSIDLRRRNMTKSKYKTTFPVK